jgi:hypothetical protein
VTSRATNGAFESEHHAIAGPADGWPNSVTTGTAKRRARRSKRPELPFIHPGQLTIYDALGYEDPSPELEGSAEPRGRT